MTTRRPQPGRSRRRGQQRQRQRRGRSRTSPGTRTGALLPLGAGCRPPIRDVVEVLASGGVPLRASQVCQALGAGGEPRHREGMRSKLKRLVGRGWLIETEPGLFTLASGVAGVLNGNGTARPN